MRIEQLESFVAVAQEGNFTRAAQRLHLAQPALTRQIAKLEEEAGSALFERTTRTVALTEAGSIFLPAATEALSLVRGALAEMRSLRDEEGTEIVVGYVFRYLSYPIAEWISEYGSIDGRVTVKSVECSFAELMAGVSEGAIDIAMMGTTDTSLIPDGLERLYLEEIHEEILVWPGHPFDGRDYVTVRDMEGQQLVYPNMKPQGAFSPMHRDLEERGIEPLVSTSGFDTNAYEAVERRLGIMGLPQSRRPTAHEVIAVPYRSDYSIKSFLLWSAGLRKKAALDLIRYIGDRVKSEQITRS